MSEDVSRLVERLERKADFFQQFSLEEGRNETENLLREAAAALSAAAPVETSGDLERWLATAERVIPGITASFRAVQAANAPAPVVSSEDEDPVLLRGGVMALDIKMIEQVLTEHRINILEGGSRIACEGCDFDTRDWTCWEEHVAPFIAAALTAPVVSIEDEREALARAAHEANPWSGWGAAYRVADAVAAVRTTPNSGGSEDEREALDAAIEPLLVPSSNIKSRVSEIRERILAAGFRRSVPVETVTAGEVKEALAVQVDEFGVPHPCAVEIAKALKLDLSLFRPDREEKH